MSVRDNSNIKHKISVDYEGMGTNVEALIKVNGKLICTISSAHIQSNKETSELIQVAVNHLVKKQKEKANAKARRPTS